MEFNEHVLFWQAKYKGAPTLTCNETSPIASAGVSQTPSDPKTGSHTTRAPNAAQEGLPLQGHAVTRTGWLSTLIWLEQIQRERRWATRRGAQLIPLRAFLFQWFNNVS